MSGWLPNIWCCNSVFNSHDTDMLIIWHWYVILDTWSLKLDIWHRYLTCYQLTLDTWHLISDTWQLTCYHLIPDICYRLVMTHLTWCCDTWLDTYIWYLYYIAYSWLSLLRGLGMIIILLLDLWYSWTLVLLYSCISEPL